MAPLDHAQVMRNPDFLALTRQRSGFAWTLSFLMLGIYFGFILLVAFAKGLLATKLGGGVTSLGIVLGVGVIISAFLLTGVYVWRANAKFDDLTRGLVQELTK